MFKLSELIEQENKRKQEQLLNDKDYNKNYYYEERQKRIKEGKEEIFIIDDNE